MAIIRVLVLVLASGCVADAPPPPVRACERVHIDLVVTTDGVRLFPRPLGEECDCSENYATNGGCVLRTTDTTFCTCGDDENGGLTPSLAAARLERPGVVVPILPGGTGGNGGRLFVTAEGASPLEFDDVELVLEGCWGLTRAALPGGSLPAPPTFTEIAGDPVSYAVAVDATTTILHDCLDVSAELTCCELPPADAVVGPGSYVAAIHDDGIIENDAGRIHVWRESVAQTPCTGIDC